MLQTEVVKQVLSLANKAVKETHRDRLEAYIHQYCRSLPQDVLEEVDPARLLSFVMDRFAFLEEDFTRTVKVEIKDPTATLLADEAPCTVIETRLPDCAFIIRTIKAFLRQQNLQTQFVLHPIHGVIHEGGQITAIDRGRGTRYSQVYMQVTQIPADKREALRKDLEKRLELTLLVNGEYPQMAAKFDEARTLMVLASTGGGPRATEAAEAVQLIDWLKEDTFIHLGYAWFPYTGETSSHPNLGLGLFAAKDRQHLEEVIGEIVATRRGRDELYSFYRTDYMTTVRSVAQVRYFGVGQPGPDGKIIGEHVFVGLLSTKGLKLPNRRVPVIASRIKDVMAKLEDQPGSYAYAKVHAILDSMPVEDLFYWTIDEIHHAAVQFRQTESKDQARVFVWRRPHGRRITVVCVVPRMRFSEALKETLSQEIRKFLQVPHLREYRAETDDESPIRMHFTVGKYRPGVAEGDLDALAEKLDVFLEGWDDQLRKLVFKSYRKPEAVTSSSRYLAITPTAQDMWTTFASRFPESYKNVVAPEIALSDLGLIEKLEADDEPLRAALMVLGDGAQRYTSLRIVSKKELLLNDVVPVLHRMALRTTSRLAERLVPGGQDIFITGFEITGNDGKRIEDPATLDRLGTIVQRVLTGQLLDDRLLGLGHLAALDHTQIDLLITYRNYLIQVFQNFGAQSVDEALLKHPQCAALFVDYFQTKFSTDRSEPAAVRAEKLLPPLAEKYDQLLQRVTVIQEDLILRYLFDLVEATRRTNYYRQGRGVIAIKIESALVEHMPRPCPLYEIYVHGPAVEGIHLRGGKVARGGIRHSDRADDFRTEVQGLQRTQTLKNTVIVPVGSKGGFVTRRQLADRAAAAAEAKLQYQAYMSGMLDITDNYVGTKIVPPPGVVRYDEDDPYLVVAADKGTAHLSDTANGISAQYKFWLDDAFASGGSAGYDHKVMGITSRGGWVNVERHFREMGVDIRKTSIKVAGVGDMSGDVFGNGMLLNEKLKLVAAFNHKHVFIDPDPDPAISYAERKRMFNAPGTQWSDYKKETISKGGGIYERAAKEIALPAEAKALLGIKAAVVSGPDIVRAILSLDVDLMWFGGIGTYVKASTEGHGEVGDKVNDNVRISATELRAKVIGEGANLAITQRGRTEYLLHGGRGNTDAIDNSAGVDCSDHEVNLKILLSPLTSTGAMSRAERDTVLRELEPDVGLACQQDNYLQSALLSMEQTRTKKHGDAFFDLLEYLDKHGLNRNAEHMPLDADLRSWITTGKGLPRNILAVLVAHTKLDLFDHILSSQIPDLPFFQPFLFSYFPSKIADKYKAQVLHHHLRREIIATVVNNAIINQAGTTLLVQLAKESSTPVDELVLRYFICDELVGGRAMRAAIHGMDGKIAADEQYAMLMALEDVLRHLLRWWSWNEQAWKLGADDVARVKVEVEAAANALVAALAGTAKTAYDARVAELTGKGFAAELAATLARMPLARDVFALIAAARDSKLAMPKAAPVHYKVGNDLHVDAFEQILTAQVPANPWERRFQLAIERDISHVRQKAIGKVAGQPDFVEARKEQADHIGDALRAVKQSATSGLVPLFLILEDYRALLS